MLLIAHRAGTDRYPEQTMAAGAFSLSEGADFAEFDVRYTKDSNVPVICHDENAKRLFGIDKRISDMTLDEFLALKRINDSTISPFSLDDLFSAGIRNVLLHLKCTYREYGPLLGVIRKHNAENTVVLGIQEPEGNAVVRAYDSRIRILAFMHEKGNLDDFLSTSCDFIRLWEPWLDDESVRRIHEAGKGIWVMSGTPGTVGYTDFRNLLKWKEMGIDGVLINEIIKAKAVLGDAR